MITQELASTEIAEMMSSLNECMADDPEGFKDREHLNCVATALAWLRGNENGTNIVAREIKDVFLALKVPALRDDMATDLIGWAGGTDFHTDEGHVAPEGFLFAQYMDSLPYTDADTELTDGTLVISFVTREFHKIVAFDLKDGQFVERALGGTLPNTLTVTPEVNVTVQ